MSAIELSHFLKQRAKELNLSAIAIAKKAGISRQTWYRLTNADVKQLRIETLHRVAGALQVSLVELSYLYTKKQSLLQKPLEKTLYISETYPFIKEMTMSTNTLVGKEEVFEKQWTIINKGHSHWINRRLVCVDETFTLRLKRTDQWLCSGKHYGGLRPQQTTVELPLVAPGEQITVSMQFYAPKEPGTVISFWKMINAQGKACFPDNVGLSCQVSVVENEVSFVTKRTQ